jgi:hypothetical protein
MGKIISNLAASVDGFITGRNPGPGHGLGDGGVLHDWYWNGDTPSTVVPGLRLSEPSLSFVDGFARGTGAVVAGRNTYDDANGWGGGTRTPRPHSLSSAIGRHHPRRRRPRHSQPRSRKPSLLLAPPRGNSTST